MMSFSLTCRLAHPERLNIISMHWSQTITRMVPIQHIHPACICQPNSGSNAARPCSAMQDRLFLTGADCETLKAQRGREMGAHCSCWRRLSSASSVTRAWMMRCSSCSRSASSKILSCSSFRLSMMTFRAKARLFSTSLDAMACWKICSPHAYVNRRFYMQGLTPCDTFKPSNSVFFGAKTRPAQGVWLVCQFGMAPFMFASSANSAFCKV